MKIVLSLLTFAFTLAITSPSVAAGGGEGGHGNLDERMNSLFPPKKAQPEKRDVPTKPELVAPAYYASIKDSAAKLEWKAVAGVSEYHVQVATDPNFKWLVANQTSVKDTNFQVSGLEAGKHYFWRVAAVKSQNVSTFTKGYFAMSMFETAK